MNQIITNVTRARTAFGNISMVRLLKGFCWASLLFVGAGPAFGFALLGPFNEAYQQGGNPNSLSLNWGGDIGGPKNIGEEYRWNVPVLYYSVDQSFLDYFGSNGLRAVDQAFAILNSLTNVSSYSRDLSEIPLDTARVNYKAQALQLLDVKTEILHLMVEQLGLAEPDRYTWQLHDRALIPTLSCPFYAYSVVKRNFDPVTWEPSSYVNGALYSYNILEFCPTPDRADAVEFLIDPLGVPFSAVASLGNLVSFNELSELDLGFIRYGFFNTGLTRDDVGGLRYLYRTNNMNVEISPTTTVQSTTVKYNTNLVPTLLFTSNLTQFAQQALTNGPAALQALYPNLAITSVSNYFVPVLTTNFTPFITNEPWMPVGQFIVKFTSNITVSVQTLFTYTFGNVFTIQFTNGQWVTVPLSNISSHTNFTFITTQVIAATNVAPWSPLGFPQLVTNTFTRTTLSNQVAGEFFIFPSNLCDLKVIAPIFTNVTTTVTTNVAAFATAGGFISLIGTNTVFFVQTTLGFFTNHAFAAFPITCDANTVALRQGVEHITFVRRDFDSLLGRFFEPVTNYYSLLAVTNSHLVKENFRREVNLPDINIIAADLANGPAIFPPGNLVSARSIFFNQSTVLTNVAGPGTIEPGPAGYFIILNKGGPIFFNQGPFFLDESTGVPGFVWGSFDGTTNEPIVYPSSVDIQAMESQVLMQISLSSNHVTGGGTFSVQLIGSGGSPPHSFSVPPGTSLPNDISVSPSGVVTGTSTGSGSVTFAVRMTDIGGLHRDQFVTIIFEP